MQNFYASGSRQISIDVLRGYFILSMASGHLAEGMISSFLHVWVWVDGAAGFVCLSGFVLGLSQRARWQRGDAAAQWWVLRRAAQIWLISIGLTLFALSARIIAKDLDFIEPVFTAERLPSALADLLLLDLHVPYFGILSMYVVFLFFAFFAVMALKRNLDVLVLAASAAVYAAVQLTADRLPPETGEPSFWRSAWQFLFFAGLVAGWRWRERLQPALAARKTPILVASAVAVVAFLVLAHSSKIPPLKDLEIDLWPYFPQVHPEPAGGRLFRRPARLPGEPRRAGAPRPTAAPGPQPRRPVRPTQPGLLRHHVAAPGRHLGHRQAGRAGGRAASDVVRPGRRPVHALLLRRRTAGDRAGGAAARPGAGPAAPRSARQGRGNPRGPRPLTGRPMLHRTISGTGHADFGVLGDQPRRLQRRQALPLRDLSRHRRGLRLCRRATERL